jgi:tetratricopeptide (TPR) repeat protein
MRRHITRMQVAGETSLWSDQFDRELTDICAIHDDISRAIANTLRLTMPEGRRPYDVDIDAYNVYLRARAMLARRGGADTKAAIELFQHAIRRDPAFAPAYAGLVGAYGVMSHQTLASGIVEAAFPPMQQAARKALELDPLLAEAHAAMGIIHARRYDWPNAQKSFRHAIDLNPSLTQTYISYWLTTLLLLERLDEAGRLLQVAQRGDPLSPIAHFELGFMKLVAGRFAEAVDHYTRARALDPDLPYLDQHFGRALTFAGRVPEALAWWGTRRDRHGGSWKDRPGVQPWLAVAYVMSGRRAEVEQMLKQHRQPYRRALMQAALGNRDQTFAELERAAEVVPHRVVPLLAYPEMRLLRGDPRLAALRTRLKLT